MATNAEKTFSRGAQRKLYALVAAGVLLFGAVAFFRLSGWGTAALWNLSHGGQWLLPLVVAAALIDSINPCAFSILLLTIAFLFSIGRARSGILKIGGAYIFGIFAVYVLIGLGILHALHLFNTPHFMARVGAALLIALGGVNIVNEFFPAFPIKLRISPSAHRAMAQFMEKGSMPTAFLLGVLVGLCEFPCTGGPYLMILGLLHDQTTYFTGVGYLLFYNAVFILPLVIILLISSNEALLEKAQNWQRQKKGWIRLGGGIAMIILGAVIFLF